MSDSAKSKKEPMNPIHKALFWALGFGVLIIISSVALLVFDKREQYTSASEARTSLRTAIVSVKATQLGLDLETFEGISVAKVQSDNPELNWQTNPLSSKSKLNTVQFVNAGTTLRLAAMSDKNYCYYVELDSQGPSLYGAGVPDKKGECDAKKAVIDNENSLDAWNP